MFQLPKSLMTTTEELQFVVPAVSPEVQHATADNKWIYTKMPEDQRSGCGRI